MRLIVVPVLSSILSVVLLPVLRIVRARYFCYLKEVYEVGILGSVK